MAVFMDWPAEIGIKRGWAGEDVPRHAYAKNHFAVAGRISSGGKDEPPEAAVFAGVCSGSRFVVSRAGETYNPKVRDLAHEFRLV